MSKKIAYCKQVPGEYQESPYMMDDAGYEGINLLGNRDYHSVIDDNLQNVMDYWNEAYEYVCTVVSDPDETTYKSVREIIEDYFPHGKTRGDYSDYDIEQMCIMLYYLADISDCYTSAEHEGYAQALTLITGHQWETATLSGCCQSDWQDIIYDATMWNTESLQSFEAEYFNTGTEWIVHDGDSVPECAEDVEGYSLYVTDWDEERGLKEALGVDSLVLWRPKYLSYYAYDEAEEV